MSIYRRNYKVTTKDGLVEVRTAKHFTIEVKSPSGKIIRKRGPRDRKAAKVAEADLIRQIERNHYGVDDPYREYRTLPFIDSVKPFIANLVAIGNDSLYTYSCQKRLERVSLEAGWTTIFDATKASFEKWRIATAEKGWCGRPTKGKTLNQFLATLMQFFDWCKANGRIGNNPLADVTPVKVIPNDDYRRSASIDEFNRKFLPALPSDDLRRFYIFLAFTALRRRTIRGLVWDDIDLSDAPRVIARAANNKPGVTQSFPLRRDVAQMLRDAKGDALGTDPVFPAVPTIDEHKEYLAAAGIPFDVDGKKRLDIHAFRKTLQTWMEDAGVDVREASKALGHSNLATTIKSYHERRLGRAEVGVEKLPALSIPGKTAASV